MPPIEPGQPVILHALPPGLLDGLPRKDQTAIRAIIGQPVTLVGYDGIRAELEFTGVEGERHTIWVSSDLLRRVA